ncbi:MAG: glycosyl transferase [Betaproteobacteria bacterium RBG_16_66_20]|nr:MAG: glycosyl transferase [Betaproteobacteria bacterium RBG_16_66_20]OGA93008.1 MAG: glycosyl transferase [Betaproteobacteria bacterium RIFCSPLOWO2_12_FULL_66_14]
MKLSIVIPTLNEAAGIARTLEALAPLRANGHEVIVADGGSEDGTRELAAALADRVIAAARGRARQMNAGAAAAAGDALLFLHADTRLPPRADQAVIEALRDRAWGRFDVRIDGRSPLLAVVAFFMNLRSRWSGIATGDQAIFARRESFPGFPEIALMEDVAFSKAMKRQSPPACLRDKAVTSGRRWERRGVLRTMLLMWQLRLAYFLGTSPDELARRYANKA